MKTGRITIGKIRREQIVDAAVAVIAEQGIQNLSLSEIEKKVGMSRGQLTYYFKAKEDILLAVFDRLVAMMHQQHEQCQEHLPPGTRLEDLPWILVIEMILHKVLEQPQPDPEFHALQYTFLSQISHREDFRRRLASLYEDWRKRGVEHLEREVRQTPPVRPISLRNLSTVVQALFHGLMMQMSADPRAIDADAVAQMVVEMLSLYVWGTLPMRAAPTQRRDRKAPNPEIPWPGPERGR